MVQIKSFGVLQTAKVAAILYFLGAAIVCIPMSVITFLGGLLGSQQSVMGGLIGGIMMLFAPLLYGAISFVFIAIGCWVYNLVAGFAGGIEIELENPQA